MKKLLMLLPALLAGCATNTIENTIGVDPTDNAIMCVEVEVPGRLTGTMMRAKRLEFPANFDLSKLTAADIDELENRLCD